MSTPTSPHEALVAQLSQDLRAADPAWLAVRLLRAQGQRVNIALEQALTLLTDEPPLVIDTLYQSSIENTDLWPNHLAQRLSTARAVLIDSPSLGSTAFQDALAQMIEDRSVRAWVKFSGSTPKKFRCARTP